MTSRFEAFRHAFRLKGMDGFLVISGPNRNYLSGFTGTAGALILSVRETLFLTDSRYTAQAKAQVQGARLQLQTKALLVDAVALVKKLGIKRLGLEADHLNLAGFLYLQKELPKVKLEASRGLIEAQRMVKSEPEKVLLRKASQIADQGLERLLPHIKPGRKETDLARILEGAMNDLGASGPSFETIMASGWRSALPHGVATEKIVRKGDFIVIDFGCIYQGYCSDMTRTVSVGKASAAQKKIYEIVRKAQAAGLKAVKSGVKAGDVDKVSRSIIARAGHARHFGHSLGHGVGREVHEEPRLGPKSEQVLRSGMAVTVEPGIYLDGKFGVRIEDLVLVNDKGHENLYKTTKQLIELKA